MNILCFVFAMVWIVSSPWFALAQHDHSKAKESPAKQSSAKIAPAMSKPAEGARIKILSPTKGQVIKGDKVPIEFKLTKGKRGHHAHAYVDGQLMGMFEAKKAPSTASNQANTHWSSASWPMTIKPNWTRQIE